MIKSVFERIRLWWKFEGRYYHKDLKSGIKNLIRWFTTIWKDRDWDDYFIFNLLIKKLEFQAKYIGDNDRHTRAKRDAEIMRTCVKLMEKIRDEDYGIEYMDYFEMDVTFEPTTLSDGEEGYEYNSEILTENFEEYFKKYPLVYKKVSKENPESSNQRIAFLMGIENHRRAKKIVFKLMENNIECWWD